MIKPETVTEDFVNQDQDLRIMPPAIDDPIEIEDPNTVIATAIMMEVMM